MGNGGSKESSKKVEPAVPVGIMITKEVAERWQATSQQSLQQGLGQQAQEANQQSQVKEGSKVDTENKPNIYRGCRIRDEDTDTTSSRVSETPTTTPTQSESSLINKRDDELADDSYYNYENMDKFANLFVHNDTQKLRNDIENGNTTKTEADFDYDSRYSIFLQKPYASTNYEEVNETGGGNITDGAKRKNLQGIEMRSGIGSQAGEPQPLNDIPVSSATLPVVVDRDRDGNPIIETVTAWKMKEQMSLELSRNDQYWNKKLHHLTAVVENETKKQAANFQRRYDRLETHNPELVHPLTPGVCKNFSSQLGKCYENNRSQVLKCNGLVQQFADCTSNSIPFKSGTQNS